MKLRQVIFDKLFLHSGKFVKREKELEGTLKIFFLNFRLHHVYDEVAFRNLMFL